VQHERVECVEVNPRPRARSWCTADPGPIRGRNGSRVCSARRPFSSARSQDVGRAALRPGHEALRAYLIVQLPLESKDGRPLFGFGPGGRPHSSSSPPSYSRGMARRQSAGPGSPGPRLARLTPGRGREASRPAPCGAPTRHFRLTPQSALGPHQELCVPGGLFPRPPVGQDLRNRLPAGAAPGPHLANASGRRPSSLDRDTQCLGEFHC
jgi:hypothetical protein